MVDDGNEESTTVDEDGQDPDYTDMSVGEGEAELEAQVMAELGPPTNVMPDSSAKGI